MNKGQESSNLELNLRGGEVCDENDKVEICDLAEDLRSLLKRQGEFYLKFIMKECEDTKLLLSDCG